MLMGSFILSIEISILKSKFIKLCSIDFNMKNFMFHKGKINLMKYYNYVYT